MSNLPKSLDEAIAQAQESLKIALDNGYGRLQVELQFPEIALKAQSIAWDFATIFSDIGLGLKVFFPDTGAAALARRDWGEISFRVSDLGSSRTPIDTKISDSDQIFLVVCPSSVEVQQIEKLCNLACDRPVILLIPQLEDISVVGIGYAARQLRERFLSTLESCYYIQPRQNIVIFRCFPSQWQVWQEQEEEEYQLIAETAQKPSAEYLEQLLQPTSQSNSSVESQPKSQKAGIFSQMQRFLKALNQ